MLFMALERFKDREAVYSRCRERGRMTPEDLRHMDSWVEQTFDRCFQLMECEDARLLDQWAERWEDLVEFEVIPVVTSDETEESISHKIE